MATTNGWPKVRFGDIVQSMTDRVADPSKAGVERYVGLEHLDSDSLRIARWGAPIDVEATKLRFATGDVIFGRRRAYQRKVALADFDGICSAHALVLRAKPDFVLPEFLPLFMQSDLFFDRALSISVGSLSPTINWRALAKQEFELPPLDEQQRIADLLWSIERATRALDSLISTLRTVESSFTRQFVCDPAYPRTPLASIIHKIVAGKSLVGIHRPARETEFGVLKVSAVGPGGFAASENKVLVDQGAFLPEFRVTAGDFLITRCNTAALVGRACIVADSAPNLMLSDKTLRFELDADKIQAPFLLAAMNSADVRTQIESQATGTGGAMKNLSQADFARLMVPDPSPARQTRVSALLERFRHTEAQLQNQRVGTTHLKSRILSSLLATK